VSAAAAHVGPAEQQVAKQGDGRKRGWTGYLLMLPGGLWLLIFFVIPLVTLISTSLYDQSGSILDGYQMTFAVEIYVVAVVG
jgi:spermidine/putrescine transport system permease protein